LAYVFFEIQIWLVIVAHVLLLDLYKFLYAILNIFFEYLLMFIFIDKYLLVDYCTF
jgi:hypothetical protein